MKTSVFHDWLYDDAVAFMETTRQKIIDGDVKSETIAVGIHLENVITLGRHAPRTQILNDAVVAKRNILVRAVTRGGGATAHGPGQIVVYPVISLRRHALSIPQLVAHLEGAAIAVLSELGEVGTRICGQPGVFVGGAKIASVGIHVRRGVVNHGLAFNVGNDLSVFSLIAPCGVVGQPITSLERLGKSRPIDDVVKALVHAVKKRLVGDNSDEQPCETLAATR